MYSHCRIDYYGLFGWDRVKPTDTEVILTTSEIDAMIIHQETGRLAVALPKGDSILPQKVRYKWTLGPSVHVSLYLLFAFLIPSVSSEGSLVEFSHCWFSSLLCQQFNLGFLFCLYVLRPFSRWTWILFELRVMEVVVTTGAIRRAKFQSKCLHQQTNIQVFTDRMPFLSPNQQCQSTEGKASVILLDKVFRHIAKNI